MSKIQIDRLLIDKLLAMNSFSIPELSQYLICGIRGAILETPGDNTFKGNQTLLLTDINYTNPRCSIILLDLKNNTLAGYPASTVPHRRSIRASALKNGIGTNCLMTGLYKDYRRGVHKPQSDTGHPALRQTSPHPVRRSADDDDYDNDDRIEYANP
ncbi:MAG: hypothetical protein EOO85_25875, partial [Pedobacter sp.]